MIWVHIEACSRSWEGLGILLLVGRRARGRRGRARNPSEMPNASPGKRLAFHGGFWGGLGRRAGNLIQVAYASPPTCRRIESSRRSWKSTGGLRAWVVRQTPLASSWGSRGMPLGGLWAAVLRPLEGRFGASWGLSGASWSLFGTSWGPPGTSWGGGTVGKPF